MNDPLASLYRRRRELKAELAGVDATRNELRHALKKVESQLLEADREPPEPDLPFAGELEPTPAPAPPSPTEATRSRYQGDWQERLSSGDPDACSPRWDRWSEWAQPVGLLMFRCVWDPTPVARRRRLEVSGKFGDTSRDPKTEIFTLQEVPQGQTLEQWAEAQIKREVEKCTRPQAARKGK